MPKTSFGVEIEFSCQDCETFRMVRDSITEQFGDRWEIGRDASVSGKGTELKTKGGHTIGAILSDFKAISGLLAPLVKEAKVWIDSTAGLHIHLGIADWRLVELENFFNAMEAGMSDWLGFQPPSRTGNRFCHTDTTGNLYHELGQIEDHHKALNIGNALFNHNTIEIRIFASTLQYYKLYNILNIVNQYIKQAVKIRRQRNTVATSSPHVLIKNKKLKKFMAERTKQLQPAYFHTIKTRLRAE